MISESSDVAFVTFQLSQLADKDKTKWFIWKKRLCTTSDVQRLSEWAENNKQGTQLM